MSAVLLVVRRELSEKVRSRPFWIMNVVLVLVILVVAVVPALLARGGDTQPVTVIATVGDDAATIVEAADAEGSDLRLEVRPVADRDAAVRALRSDDAQLALVGSDEVLGLERPDGRTVDLLDGARRLTLLDGALADAGIAPDERTVLLSPAPLGRTTLDPVDESPGPDPTAIGAGLTAVALLYGLLIFYGQQVAQGIVQEKQSRVIEVLLATLRPIELLGGKLLGLGLLGLLQVSCLGLVGFVALLLSGRQTVPPAAVPTVIAAIAWFIVGYALYATVFALAAAVVAKVEDLQTAMTIPILLLVSSFALVQFSFADPDGTIALIAAYLPTSAPIAQPLRVALGVADVPSMLGGLVSAVAATAVLVPITARVHAGAALAVRQRISVADAVRRSRT